MAKLWAVVGATGTGKSDYALDLAERLIAQGETAAIVNADAMQLYRGMNIGTAKLTMDERRGIEHRQLDVLAVTDEASVAAYQREARRDIEALLADETHAILVGGSGLYVSSVLFDFSFPGTDAAVRAALEAELEALGPGELYQRLRAIDEKTATDIGPHNGRRLVRALEVITITGEPSAARLPDEPVWWMPAHVTRLEVERAELVARLDARVERMWSDGLLDEVAELLEQGLADGVTARKAIGYAQAWAQLRGELSQAEAIAETQRLTRTYARRQVNWFSRIPPTLAE